MKKEILKKINDAFFTDIYIGDEDIVYNNSIDHLECNELKKQFSGIKWQDVSFELMFQNKDSLPFFSTKGFKYYLPAFMIYIVSDYYGSDTLADNVISKLTLPEEIDSIKLAQSIKQFDIDAKLPEFDFEGFLYEQLENIDDNIKCFIEMVSFFSIEQKIIIHDFLKYIDENYQEDVQYSVLNPKLAIDRFWFQFT